MENMRNKADEFAKELEHIRAHTPLPPGRNWYPYSILANVGHIDRLLIGSHKGIFDNLAGKVIIDIGGADGDFAFLLERLGASVDIVDNAPTNANALIGAQTLKAALGSNVNILDMDLDRYFDLPRQYDFALFLGILYHLKNPYGALENLSRRVSRMIMSTRVTMYSAPTGGERRLPLMGVPAAYLLDPLESNNDPTNYWIFTEAGLERVLKRSGWEVICYMAVGSENSDPASAQGDQRVFVYAESRNKP